MAAVASADANFHHGRLRLSIFLRAVEQSDMPQRPSRFRRRFKASDESSRELNDRPVQDGDHQEPGTCALIDSPSPIHSPAPSDPIATVSDKATHVPNSLEDRLETSDDHADVADDIAERLTGLSEPPSIQNTPRTRKQLEVTTSSKTRVYKAHSDSSSTRKRRLPVNCLALLRTSTLEGLPEPGDAEIMFATPIGEIDPIEDSQMHASYVPASRATAFPSRVDIDLSREAARDVRHQLRSQNTATILQQRSLLVNSRGPATPARQKQAIRPKVQFFADGFVGDERNITSTKKQRRQGRQAPREAKKTPAVAALALANGALPMSLLRAESPSASTNVRPASLQAALPETRHSNDTNPHNQLVFTGVQPANGIRPQQHKVEQRASAIRSQLASITAPMRRESDSSASEEGSEYDREGSYDAEQDSSEEAEYPSAPFLHLNRRATVVRESHSYFEKAKHGLDIERRTGIPKEEYWSQYGMVED